MPQVANWPKTATTEESLEVRKLDTGEIRRIKKSAYAKATADKTAFASVAKAGKSAKTQTGTMS